jgi:UDP-N-acetylglucosamine acyltransferase
VVGLRRAGFSQEQRSRIKSVYRLIFRCGLRLAESLARAEREHPGAETTHIVRFIAASQRGIISFA